MVFVNLNLLSKIIFTTRKDEDDWFRSFSNQMEEDTTWLMTFLMYFSPHCRRMFNYVSKMSEYLKTVDKTAADLHALLKLWDLIILNRWAF